MVKIRLRRTGKTKQPCYRVVVADSRSPRDGRFIEIIGHYEPVRQPKVLNIKTDRARYWLGVGAQPSETVMHLFKQVQVIDNEGNIIPETDSDGVVMVDEEESEQSVPQPVQAAPAPAAAPASVENVEEVESESEETEQDEDMSPASGVAAG
jgi:small subunit ribosomal protein S16